MLIWLGSNALVVIIALLIWPSGVHLEGWRKVGRERKKWAVGQRADMFALIALATIELLLNFLNEWSMIEFSAQVLISFWLTTKIFIAQVVFNIRAIGEPQ